MSHKKISMTAVSAFSGPKSQSPLRTLLTGLTCQPYAADLTKSLIRVNRSKVRKIILAVRIKETETSSSSLTLNTLTLTLQKTKQERKMITHTTLTHTLSILHKYLHTRTHTKHRVIVMDDLLYVLTNTRLMTQTHIYTNISGSGY